MMAADESMVTFAQAGVIPYAETSFELLPLMHVRTDANDGPLKPPLERLPRGDVEPDRIVFETVRQTQSLPTEQKTSWVASTHVFPSAYPRVHYVSTSPPGAPFPQPEASRAGISREEEKKLRERDLDIYEEQATLCSVESFYPPLSAEEAQRTVESLASTSGQPQLWSTVQRIVPVAKGLDRGISTSSKPITLFLAHANGFHKEIWEPALETLINELESQDGVHIEEVWSLDAFNSGDAGILNRPHLSSSMSWFDNARDIWQFLDYYLPTQSPPKDRTDFGPRWPPVNLPVTTRAQGRRGRTIIGIGHSYGGASMHLLNMCIGDIMAGQISIDPIIIAHEAVGDIAIPRDVKLARSAVARKDVFANRAAAVKYMASRPFFAAWSPNVLDLHCRFGLTAVPGHEHETDPPVTLSMSKWSEAQTFAASWTAMFASLALENNPRFDGWAHLITTRYLDSSPMMTMGKERSALHDRYAKLGSRYTSESVSYNHLVVQEKPVEIGTMLASILHQRVVAAPALQALPKEKL